MKNPVRLALAIILIVATIASLPAEAATPVTLGSGFNYPTGIAVDGTGNVYVGDTENGAVKEILAPGYSTVTHRAAGSPIPVALRLMAAAMSSSPIAATAR